MTSGGVTSYDVGSDDVTSQVSPQLLSRGGQLELADVIAEVYANVTARA